MHKTFLLQATWTKTVLCFPCVFDLNVVVNMKTIDRTQERIFTSSGECIIYITHNIWNHEHTVETKFLLGTHGIWKRNLQQSGTFKEL